MAAEYYVSPCGNDDSGDGSLTRPWKTPGRAQTAAAPGDTVYLRGGKYKIDKVGKACGSQTDSVDGVLLNKSGAENAPVRYEAYLAEIPVLDFSGVKEDCRVKGVNISASWVTLKGVEITGVPQNNKLNNESWGVWVNGSHNVLERLNVHHIMGAGVFIQEGGDNLVLNTDSHHNYDPNSKSGAGQNADGFGAHVKAGNPGNVFRGCRAWANTDDGFDLINAYSPVVIENSAAWMHGYLPGTSKAVSAGNGNGFKMGGYVKKYVAGAPKHVVRNSVAFKNKAAGFYMNHHPTENDFIHNTAYDNGVNFNMQGIDSGGKPLSLGYLQNNLAYKGKTLAMGEGVKAEGNSWQTLGQISEADFASLAIDEWEGARGADGSLPKTQALRLAPGSKLKGTAVKTTDSSESGDPGIGP